MSSENLNNRYSLYTINTDAGIIDVRMVAQHRIAVTVKQMNDGLRDGESVHFAGFAANQAEAKLMKARLKETRAPKLPVSKVRIRRAMYGDWSDKNRFVDWRWSTVQGLWLYY